MQETKPFNISKRVVFTAYKKVKANKGTYGVDKQSIEDFEKNLKNNLYKIWNRMSSGSYFPKPVKAVAIPTSCGVYSFAATIQKMNPKSALDIFVSKM